MGNLDGSTMDGVTGAIGPAMVLRSIFTELNRNQDTRDLPLSPQLIAAKVCRRDGRSADATCDATTEWFVPGTQPTFVGVGANAAPLPTTVTPLGDYRLLQPTPGLQVARDPRIPKEFEALPMQVASVPGLRQVQWFVDGILVSSNKNIKYSWPLARGTHEVYARIWVHQQTAAHDTELIRYYVR